MSINDFRASRHLHKTMVSTMIKSRHKDKAKLFSFVTFLGKYRLGHYTCLEFKSGKGQYLESLCLRRSGTFPGHA